MAGGKDLNRGLTSSKGGLLNKLLNNLRHWQRFVGLSINSSVAYNIMNNYRHQNRNP